MLYGEFVIEKCYVIYHIHGKLVVNLANKRINIVNRFINVLSTVSLVDEATYCSATNYTIYHGTETTDAIHCCSFNGSVKWKFSCGKSYQPLGITHDASRNVFVTCEEANKVIVFDPTSKDSKVLLTNTMKMNYICLEQHTLQDSV